MLKHLQYIRPIAKLCGAPPGKPVHHSQQVRQRFKLGASTNHLHACICHGSQFITLRTDLKLVRGTSSLTDA